ncbi:formylglycine-generating enzyme family protein [Thiohalocapsa marina]|uniref:formylglycine-generating enzyme family protein n=1 Tax=Thiohalocapsa marina TaxID=424902 RepID=UPI001FE8554E|nr:SUMF1/EgtB/PvdO family nonheme iron enzyme [Thiohalocapsa marina]
MSSALAQALSIAPEMRPLRVVEFQVLLHREVGGTQKLARNVLVTEVPNQYKGLANLDAAKEESNNSLGSAVIVIAFIAATVLFWLYGKSLQEQHIAQTAGPGAAVDSTEAVPKEVGEKSVALITEITVERERLEAFEPRLVAIDGGCFAMGSPLSESDRRNDERQHWVCVDDFVIGKYEVTQAQWVAVMGSDPSGFSGCDDCPVESVSFNDVQKYINKLNSRTGRYYRLPTEAEWEYAARAGTKTARHWGKGIGTNNAHCDGCGSNFDVDGTVRVGSFPPNPWGLHDMLGNVRDVDLLDLRCQL